MSRALPRVGIAAGGSASVAVDGVAGALARMGLNTGNILFQQAIASQIRNPKVMIEHLGDQSALRDQIDVLVIPAANQIGQDPDGGWADLVESLDKPTVVVGLGAQAPTIKAETVKVSTAAARLAKALSLRSSRIGVRGPFTAGVLEAVGVTNTVVMGCPSLHLNPNVTGEGVREKLTAAAAMEAPRMAFLPGTMEEGARDAEKRLAQFAFPHRADLIYQTNHDMFRMIVGEPYDEEYPRWIQGQHQPHMTFASYAAYVREHGRFYTSASSWLDDMRRYDLVFGMRLHGAMAAIQGGSLGICVTFDSRTEELAETVELPRVRAEWVTGCWSILDLVRAAQFNAEWFDDRRHAFRSVIGDIFAEADVSAPHFQD